MEILELIDALEELASSSRKLPVAHRSLVDPAKLLELVDQLRIAVPKDVQEAQEILGKREQIINASLLEAKRIKNAAENESRARLDENELVKKAQKRAEEITEEAQRRAQRMLDQSEAEVRRRRADADQYAQGVLYKLEQQVSDILGTVRKGIELLETDREASLAER